MSGSSHLKRKLTKKILYDIYRHQLPSPVPGGEVFFVNGYSTLGNDSNVGDSEYPFRTLTYAISKCEDDRNDTIYVMNYWRPSTETFPIAINKNRVHIIGLAQQNLPYPAIHPSTDVGCFQFRSNGQYGSIENLTIGGGVSYAGVVFGGGTSDGMLIKNCTFGHSWFGTPLNGVQNAAADSHSTGSLRIENCTFLGDLQSCNGAITGNAIDLLKAGGDDLEVVDCIFMGCAVGVNLVGMTNGRLLDNRFIVDDAADGEAIALDAACRGNMVDGNHAMSNGTTGMVKQPYVDVAATVYNSWGVNWTAEAVDLPKQTA